MTSTAQANCYFTTAAKENSNNKMLSHNLYRNSSKFFHSLNNIFFRIKTIEYLTETFNFHKYDKHIIVR
jgi:hypothetical protein